MNNVRFGVIGVGNQGTYYAKGLFNNNEIINGEITAVCDINPVKLKKIKETFGDSIKYFTDYKEMIKSGLIDAVLIETPHYTHSQIAIDCMNSGIHVLCDKPAGVYTKQVNEMNECAKRCQVLYAIMFNQRTNCLYKKMKEIISNGELGEIQRINWIVTNWFRNQNYYDSGSWRATWDGEGGGVLINQCFHQLDLIQWIVGEMPKNARGFCKYGKWHDIEVEDDVTAYFEYKNGATGVFIATTGESPGSNRLEISGSKGKLLCENNELVFYKNSESSFTHSKQAKDAFSTPKCEIINVNTDGENPQHKGIINNFIDAILGKDDLFVNGIEGINAVELMNAIELSGWKNGDSVSIPVNPKTYLRYLNKMRKKSSKKVGSDDEVIDSDNTMWNGKV
ncbi:MAG: Gfo/Idh/MocA family oxidoreductase [Clostridia bacterium]|nr:Gfo/Idh/MocA family oxidoreductase [Clostridia bacterium]